MDSRNCKSKIYKFPDLSFLDFSMTSFQFLTDDFALLKNKLNIVMVSTFENDTWFVNTLQFLVDLP